MTSDRRNFLRLAGAASTAALAGIAHSTEASPGPAASTLSRSDFARALGEEFAFEAQVLETRVARLSKVEPLSQARTAAEAERQFRLVFKLESGGLDQATYRVNNARLGEFVMFVSPRTSGRDVVEAIFNRA